MDDYSDIVKYMSYTTSYMTSYIGWHDCYVLGTDFFDDYIEVIKPRVKVVQVEMDV